MPERSAREPVMPGPWPGSWKAPFERLPGRFAHHDRGSMLPVMAMLMLLATAGGALAVDVARGYAMKSDLQAAADAAALSAAIMLPDLDEARRAAKRVVQRNLPNYADILRDDDFQFGHWQATKRSISKSDGAASAVRVTVRLTESRGNGLDTLFSGLLGKDVLDVASSAVAGKRGVACLIALEPHDKGLELNGDAELELSGCGAQINSTDKEALKASGDSRLTGDSVCVTGGANIDKSADVLPQPSEGCPPHADPIAELPMPEFSGCTDRDVEYEDKKITLTADRVFCKGLKIKGKSHVILKPGLYVIDNGKLEIDDDAVLEGDGVTILLHGEKAEMDIKGDAALRLTAPTSGPMQGLLIVQSEGGEKDNKWDSKSVSELTGVVYLPSGKFTSKIEANITGTDACFVLIANKIKIDGKAKMNIDLSSTACRQSLPSAFSRSVGLLD